MDGSFWGRRRQRTRPPLEHPDLGDERSRYVVSERYLRRARGTALVLALIGFPLLALGILMSLRSGTVWWEGAGPSGLGIAFLLLGEILRRQARRAETLDIRFFERGMTFVKDGSVSTIRWDAVQTYVETHRNRRNGWRNLSCRFVESSGRVDRLKVDSNQLPGVHRIQFEIALGCARAHREEARAAWSAGETLDFGPMRISPQGITHGATRIDWDAVTRARVKNGKLRIRRAGRRVDWVVWLAGIPNVPVLLDLMGDRLTEVAEFSDLTVEFEPTRF